MVEKEAKPKKPRSRKSRNGEDDLPSEWEIEKFYTEQIAKVAASLPWDRIILSAVFSYGWWKAYGKEFKIGDILLGAVYGFTIPEALKGGLVANTYAVSALAVLGLGLGGPAEPEKVEAIKAVFSDAIPDFDFDGTVETVSKMLQQ